MKKYKLLFCFALLINIGVYSQSTYEIDYSNVGTGANCNVFANPVSISGFVHQTTFGLPHFGVTDVTCTLYNYVALKYGLVVPNGTSSTTVLTASGYSIQFNFKKNCHYEISVLGKSKSSSTQSVFSNVGLLISQTNGGTNTNTNCSFTPTPNLSQYYQGTFDNYDCSGSDRWITPLSIDLDQDANYLLVGGATTGSGGDGFACIKKIKIIETPALIPKSQAILCGSSTPITYSVAIGNSTNVSSYIWNLGANNGWLYNGVAAPQTITTSSNTITLVPACGSVQSNISASVISNGITYNTNPSTISYAQPSLSITGNNGIICSTENYSIAGLPCGGSVSWSASPAGIVNIIPGAGGTATVTKLSTGTIDLTAEVTTCGVTQTLTLSSIRVGTYAASDMVINTSNGVNNYCYGTGLSFFTNNMSGATNFTWTYPSNWTLITGGQSTYIALLPQPSSGAPPPATITVSANSCGSVLSTSRIITYSSNACAVANPYTLSPNPATSSYVYIQSTNPQMYIAAIQITDMMGNVLINNSYPPMTYSGMQLGIYSLSNGPKIARISNGSQWFSIQFTIQH